MALEGYFKGIETHVKEAYGVAEEARKKGHDLEDFVDIPTATDLAEKSVKLITSSLFPELNDLGVISRIRELEEKYSKSDERIALVIGKEIAQNKFFKFDSLERGIEAGVRIGLSYMTMGVVTAPLEGINSVKIKKNSDGSEYLAIYYSGPIRSAGGTGQAMSVVLADYIRKEVNLDRYKPTKDEVERYGIEVEDYFTRVTKKQYTPSRDETRMIAQNVCIEITGTPTERYEVSNFKDLERVETNVIRGGMCLIYLDGLPLKAPKLRKKLIQYGKDFGLEHWNWLEKYLEMQAKIHSTGKKTEGKYKPSSAFLDDIVGGRPVFSHPGAFGGFRPRYGRSRASGDATTSLHPATMEITNKFIAVGTQLRLEYPGKATTPTVCDSIHPPIVRLKNGDVIKIKSRKQAEEILKEVEKIIFLGDILIPYGEFVKNGKNLIPSPFVEEWWILELEKVIEKHEENLKKFLTVENLPTPDEALKISQDKKIPLHPEYLYLWNYINKEDVLMLKEIIEKFGKEINYSERLKYILERLWATHIVRENKIILDDNFYYVSKFLLKNITSDNLKEDRTILENLSSVSGIKLMEKAPLFIGARMGRPEKARRRTLKGKPQILFPCGRYEGGRLRNLIESYKKGYVKEEFPLYKCEKCGMIPFKTCVVCGEKTKEMRMCIICNKITNEKKHCDRETKRSGEIKVNLSELFSRALVKTGGKCPELLKSPRAVMGKDRSIEPLEKGILRQKYDLYVNKDGTIRYDASNIALTHFKPQEIGTSLEKLRKLGYDRDINGNELISEEQVLMMKPQDIIISNNEVDSCLEYLFRISKFVDDLLEKLYGLNAFYNLKSREDLIGHLVIGLAPHTSAGIIGRIIGFTKHKCILAHPFWHGAKRRDCDGDEDSVLLLMDALLNFSRNFLPQHTGGKTMDACLILSSKLNPDEVDNESWTPEVVRKYSLEFYYDTLEYKTPGEVKVETFESLMKKGNPFEFYYTHETSNLEDGPSESSYITMHDMSEKVKHQLELARKILAVNENAVAELILRRHFFGDLKGNMAQFGRQRFRCSKCNSKYRRIPLSGLCGKCNSKLIFTVHEGSIKKYLEPSEQIAEAFEISPYMRQQIMILKYRLTDMFGKDEKQFSLGSFVTSSQT